MYDKEKSPKGSSNEIVEPSAPCPANSDPRSTATAAHGNAPWDGGKLSSGKCVFNHERYRLAEKNPGEIEL